MSDFQYLKGASERAGESLLTRTSSDKKRGDGFKLKEDLFMLDVSKGFFTMRVVKHWKRLLRVVDGPSMEIGKVSWG